MATFTIDLLTGNVYLFNGDFSGSGSTPTSGATYPEVNVFSELPSPSAYSGKIYVVRSSSGDYVLNRKEAGLYFSNGSTWRRLGDTPSFFLSDNFQIIDSGDNTKGIEFVTSGVTTNEFRQIQVQDSDGTIAYLTDLDTKVDTSAFNDYTGTTAPDTFVDWTYFGNYSATTLSLINSKQNQLVEGDNISISGNVISVTGFTTNPLTQLLDEVGGQQVNNVIATPIIWSTEEFSGATPSFTGGSRIYIQETATYELGYVLNLNGDTNNFKNVGAVVRKNGTEDITPMSTASVNIDLINDTSVNTMPSYYVDLNSGDYVELVAFRIGLAGETYTKENGSWFRIRKND